MARAEALLEEERGRVERYLHESTLPKLLAEVQRWLVASRMAELLARPDDGLVHLIMADATAELARCYRLLRPEAVTVHQQPSQRFVL
eukprot:SAG11_NODE_582_length_8353_cov_28.953356_3_plen_88_part_00